MNVNKESYKVDEILKQGGSKLPLIIRGAAV